MARDYKKEDVLNQLSLRRHNLYVVGSAICVSTVLFSALPFASGGLTPGALAFIAVSFHSLHVL
jgi:hypothetical protein